MAQWYESDEVCTVKIKVYSLVIKSHFSSPFNLSNELGKKNKKSRERIKRVIELIKSKDNFAWRVKGADGLGILFENCLSWLKIKSKREILCPGALSWSFFEISFSRLSTFSYFFIIFFYLFLLLFSNFLSLSLFFPLLFYLFFPSSFLLFFISVRIGTKTVYLVNDVPVHFVLSWYILTRYNVTLLISNMY